MKLFKLLLAITVIALCCASAARATDEIMLSLDSVRHYDELSYQQGPETFHMGVYLKNFVGHTHKCAYLFFTVEYNANVLTPVEFQLDVPANYGVDMITSYPFGAQCYGTGGSLVGFQIPDFGESSEGLYLSTNALVKVGDIVWQTVNPDPPSGGWQGNVQITCRHDYGGLYPTEVLIQEADGTPVGSYGYGTTGAVFVNSCVRWFDNGPSAPNCPTGTWFEPCAHCPPDLSEKVHVGIPVRGPRPGGWTDVTPSPWSAIKGLYR